MLRGTAVRVSAFRPPEHGVGQVAEVAPSLVFFAHFRPVLRRPLPGFFGHDHRHSFPEPQEEEPVYSFLVKYKNRFSDCRYILLTFYLFKSKSLIKLQVRQTGQSVPRTLHDIGPDLSRPTHRNIRPRTFPLALVYTTVRYAWLYYQFRQA